MEEQAEAVREAIEDVVGDGDLRVLSFYSAEEQGVAYIREDVRDRYSEQADREVLENALMETMAKPAYEDLFDGTIHATTRIFDDTLVTTVATNDRAGILFSLDRDGEYKYREVISRVENVVCED